METEFRVRAATVDDARMLEALFDALGHPATAPAISRRIARLRADASYESWVAVEDGDVIGFAAGHILYPVEDDQPAAQLIALVTTPAHQGTGAGSALCSEFETWARNHGARRLLVNSGEHRVESHGFYERRGYSRTGVRFGKVLAHGQLG